MRAAFLGIVFCLWVVTRVGAAEGPTPAATVEESTPAATVEESTTAAATEETTTAAATEEPTTAAATEEPTTAAATEEPTTASVVEALEAKYAAVEALKADFVQTTRSAVYGDDEQRGTLLVKRPAMMRWEFHGGEERHFVTDGKTMWVYTKSDQEVIRYDNVGGERSALDSLLSSLDQIDELFDVRLAEGTQDAITLDLTPHEQEQVKRARLVLTDALVIQHLTIVDPFDSVTDLAFSNVQLDPEIPDSAFVFEVPEGVEIIVGGGF
ncbi:MAG: outer membrane lipoprotein carrier protein LolA [Deltaproteobacteria bacterium]|nr:outer membrane lipoprotein carrier protein LolA [Deltaproteobacteria bacterium]